MKTLQQLRTDLRDTLGQVKEFEDSEFLDDAGEARDLTEDEQKSHTTMLAKAESIMKQIETMERSERIKAENAKVIETDGEDDAAGEGGPRFKAPAAPKKEADKFETLGHFLQSVAEAGMNNGTGQRDPRLIWQKAAGANEAIPSEGGFLVQTDHSTELLAMMHDMGDIISRVRNVPVSGSSNGIELPIVDEKSRQTGSRFGGVRAYWVNEGQAATDSKPAFGKLELKLNKLMAIGYATEELLNDAAALQSIMGQAFAEEMTFETEDAYVNGTGSGQPLGFLNGGSLVTVAKEGAQSADTVVVQNVLNIWDRMPTRSRRNAVWLTADSLIEPALFQMTMPNSNIHIFLPPGQNGATEGNSSFGNLLGRPVIPSEYFPTLGDAGDIGLYDLSQYITIDKGGVAQNSSMHVRFLWDEMTFKVTYRVDGQPGWKQAVTTANGASTKSPFVTLAERA